jgi:hypothetical protein
VLLKRRTDRSTLDHEIRITFGAVLAEVESFEFFGGRDAQADGVLEDQEQGACGQGCPNANGQDTGEL